MKRPTFLAASALGLVPLCLTIACDPGATGPSVHRLAFSVQPSPTTAGTTIAPSVQVAALNLAGDTVTSFTSDVTVVITPGTGTTGATLTGTTTATVANGRLVSGVATFSDLKIDLAGSNYTLTATSGILTSATSAPVTMAPRASTLAHLSAGGLHSCGLTPAGAAYCWGSNSRGQLGDGTKTERLTPVAVAMPAGATFTSVSAGQWKHTCGLTPAGAAYCWGYNCYGQLGDGTTHCPRLTPTAVVMPTGVTFASVAVGAFHTCGLNPAGAAYCWGHNGNGEVGDGTAGFLIDRLTPTAVVMPTGVTFTSLSAGSGFSCGLTPVGAAYCWGSNEYGQVGDDTTTDRLTPVEVAMPAGVTFASVSAGGDHACGLTPAGAAYCWGGNADGQLGDGTTTGRLAPTAVVMPAGVTFTGLSAGSRYSCGLTPAGAAYCWGHNFYGQLGDGTTASRLAPTAVVMPAGVTFTSVSAGGAHTCGLTPVGAAYCWGSNFSGQLGDDTTTDRLTPVKAVP